MGQKKYVKREKSENSLQVTKDNKIVTSEGLCPQAKQTQIKDNSNIIAGGLKAKSKDKNLRGARRKDSSMKAMGVGQ